VTPDGVTTNIAAARKTINAAPGHGRYYGKGRITTRVLGLARSSGMIKMDFRGHGGGGKVAGTAGKLGLSLFFFVFFAMGSLFEVFILREFGRAMGQRSWQKTPCRIVSSEIQEQSGSDFHYLFAVSYEYEYGGHTYTGSVYKRGYSSSDKYSAAQSIVQRYPSGANLFCYVNPGNPGEAVLQRDSLAFGLVFFFPLIFVLIGAGGIYFIWKKPRPEAEKPIAAAARQGGRGLGKFGQTALFGVFALVGAGMLYPLGIKPIARTIAAESWVATPCKVLRAEVRDHDSDDGTTYSVYILYQYEFQGQTYKSDRYEFVGGSSSGYKGKARVVEQYKTAANPVCYVNPENPSDAVLKRGFHAKLLLALFPLPFLLIGVGGLVATWRGKSIVGGKVFKPCIPLPPSLARDELALLRVADGGRTVLRPKASAKTKFIGMTVAALFWNGIVSIFVMSALNDLRRGDPSWSMLLFLLPFVAVGLGLIAGAVYQFLALFNPRPTLELSSGVVALGGTAELSWNFAGQISRIQELTVTLRGVEEARYRRGTSTYTDRNTFYELELYRTSDPREIASGQVGLVLPQDTMHSFEAENNKILWSLDIHGRIQGWPDVKESFGITVTPGAVS
jgi:hypothetical protein